MKSVEITVEQAARGYIVTVWGSEGKVQYAASSLLEARGIVNSVITTEFHGFPEVQAP